MQSHIKSRQNNLHSVHANLDLNEIIDNSEKIANEFNNFFVSIGHNLAKDITIPFIMESFLTN